LRPVNLIPSDQRRGAHSPMRTGAFSYVLIGALALALLGVIALVFAGKQVSDRKHQIADLQVQEQQVTARAQSLQAFADFRAAQQTRSDTVTSLAQSRFDWQRVLDELARVIPSNVWLTQLAGTADPSVTLQNAPQIPTRASVPGPALEIVGCGTGQDAVAGLVSNLEEIDGVTRVGVQSSGRATDSSSTSGSSATSDSGGTSSDCRTRQFITRFEIVVAFDAVPTPATATASPSVPTGTSASGGSQLASQSTASPSTGG
jgi:Tfp pilus assembly protein PilN